MFRLTREVRFAIPQGGQPAVRPRSDGPANGHGGFPPLAGLGHWFALRATLAGELDPASSYLLNIKHVDRIIRERAVPMMARAVADGSFGDGASLLRGLHAALADAWSGAGASLEELELALSPYCHLATHARELPMVRLSQRFEFSASHRLHNPQFTDEQNRSIFGKCSNPHGHGHNYELQVTLRGQPREDGVLIDVPLFERTVIETVIDRLDHRNLNVEVAEFETLNPSVENIAKVIYRLLKPKFAALRVELAAVTVWETPKTWCEYSE